MSPLAHATASVTLIDASLFRFDEIWAAAGHPHAVFQLSPWQLQDLTGAPVADLAVDDDEKNRDLQRAITLVRLRAQALDTPADVPSPCISICRMSVSSGLCEGCFRTGDEIAGWSSAGNDGKRALWKLIEQRMDALQGATVM